MKQCPYCYNVLESADLIDLEKPKPNHCCCNPRDWGFEIPPVCSSFHQMSEEEPYICKSCEHEIESTDWAKRLKKDSPVSYPQALVYAAHTNLEVVIEYRTDLGECLWAIIVNDDEDFWMEAFKTQAEAVAFCEVMGWKIVT